MYFGVPPIAPVVRGMVRPLMPQPHGFLTARPYVAPPIRAIAPVVHPYTPPRVYSPMSVMPGIAQREAERQQALQIQQQKLQLQQQRLQFQQQQALEARQAAQQAAQAAILNPTQAPVVTSTPLPYPQPNVSPAAPESDLTPAQDAAAPMEPAPKPHRGKLLLFGLVAIGGGVGIYMFTRKKKAPKAS